MKKSTRSLISFYKLTKVMGVNTERDVTDLAVAREHLRQANDTLRRLYARKAELSSAPASESGYKEIISVCRRCRQVFNKALERANAVNLSCVAHVADKDFPLHVHRRIVSVDRVGIRSSRTGQDVTELILG